jgi:hypothetical protein
VILDTGWSGEDVLVRLLSAVGTVRIRGHVLARTVKQPARHLRRAIAERDGVVQGALVQPEHLWLANAVDPWHFVADLVSDGFVVISLHRSSAIDRGVSRALCGPAREVLPNDPRRLDAAAVSVFARQNELAAEWFPDVVPTADLRLEFERHLCTEGARSSTAATVATALGLAPWAPPPEREAPTSDALWRRVLDPVELRDQLTTIEAASGA